jgi:hypothetical protein
MSVWRGTADVLLAALFTKMEWLAPSLSSSHPCVPPDVEPARGASRTDLERLPNQFGAGRGFFDQIAICLKHHLHGFLKVRSSLFKCGSLGVGAGHFLHEPDVALW